MSRKKTPKRPSTPPTPSTAIILPSGASCPRCRKTISIVAARASRRLLGISCSNCEFALMVPPRIRKVADCGS